MKISNDKLMEILERNLGLPMGDGGIYYIQDPGQKRINKIYFSKDDMLLYKCTADTTDVTVTGNFKVYSLTNSDDYIEGLTGIGRGGVKYIQDAGTKLVNNVYIDRPTGKLYKCIMETSSVNNDANFKEHNVENVAYCLDNLYITQFFAVGNDQLRQYEFKPTVPATQHGITSLIAIEIKNKKKIKIIIGLSNPIIIEPKIYELDPSTINVEDMFHDGNGSSVGEVGLRCVNKNNDFILFCTYFSATASPTTIYDNTILIQTR